MSELYIVITLLVYLLAGLVKGTLGIGFPTAAIAFTAVFLDARTAISLVVIPMLLTNIWQVYRSGNVIGVWRKNWRLAICMVAMIMVFSRVTGDVPMRVLTMMLGVVTASFAIVSLLQSTPSIPKKYDSMMQVIAGLVAGTLGGLVGVWAPPIVMYLSSQQLDIKEFVQSTGLLLGLGSLVLLGGYWQVGIINANNAPLSLMLIVPAILGFTVGEKLRSRLKTETFRQILLIFFFLMGLNLIRRAYFM